MAMPLHGPRASVPSSERRRRSSWVPPWMIGQRAWAGKQTVGRSGHQFTVPRLAPVQPPERALHSFLGQLVRRLSGHDVIERHRDVGAERPLDLHRPLGRECPIGAVDVRLELDAVLTDPAKPLEREHLKAARVGQHRPRPRGEAVESAHGADDVLPGTQVQVVGVAQDDLRAGARDIGRAQAPDHAVRAHRHERRGLHRPVRQGQRAGPGLALGGVEAKAEQRGRRRRHRRAQRITMASPYE